MLVCRRGFAAFALGLGLLGCNANPISGSQPQDPQDPSSSPDPVVSGGLGNWDELCVSCHGEFPGSSAISVGNANGDFRLDAESAVREHGDALAKYIEETMPFQNASACTGECAQQTAAYIRSRQQPMVPTECDAKDTPYGVRELKLLTSREYQRALEDLLGIGADYGTLVANNDSVLGGFPNMRGKGVNDATLQSYISNAEAIATWAVNNNRPFSCAGTDCGARFVDEFLFRAFRGPVSGEQRALFAELFESNPNDGMRLALEAALTSPYFLYRIEAGVDLQTALERGYYSNVEPPPMGGEVSEVISAQDFPRGSGALEGDVWAFTQNGGVELSFETGLADPATLEFDARGSNHDALWPELTVRVQGELIDVQLVDSPELRTYRFEVTGQAGAQRVRVEFNNDSGVPPYGQGQDVNLYIAEVRLLSESSGPPPPPPTSAEQPLEGVDAGAFVLTPYEFASALSFMLTGSTPDARLLAEAQADRLTTRAQIEAQVTRLIDSPRGREHFGDFVAQWFGLDKVRQATRMDVPEFTAEVKEAMVQEVRAHFAHVFYEEDAPFSEFYGGDYTFLNRTLADFYGVQGQFSERFAKTEVEGRGGPIASGAFMAANAHAERTAPILRAVHVRQAALCHHIDPPNSPIAGDDIDAQRAEAQARVAEREQQEGALSSRDFYFLYTDGIDACAGCHERIINPMFGMEDFDRVGRLRPSAGADLALEMIHGVEKEVSLQGTLFGVDSVSDPTTITYSGAKDLSNKIAQTEAVQDCLVRRGFRYVTGLTFTDRDLDTGNREMLTDAQRSAYGCAAERMKSVLQSSGESPRAMFITLATESLVRLRR